VKAKSLKDFDPNSFDEFVSRQTVDRFAIAEDYELPCVFDDLIPATVNFA